MILPQSRVLKIQKVIQIILHTRFRTYFKHAFIFSLMLFLVSCSVFKNLVKIKTNEVFITSPTGVIGKLDKDGDGIPDDKDKCPTLAGPIALNGCPDTDKDGIPDHEDACPKQFGLKEYNGCADTDKDGIPDNEDACPNSYGLKKDKGCPIIAASHSSNPNESKISSLLANAEKHYYSGNLKSAKSIYYEVLSVDEHNATAIERISEITQKQKSILKPNPSILPEATSGLKSTASPDVDKINAASQIDKQNIDDLPLATVTYAYKNKIIMPRPSYIKVMVQLDKPIVVVEQKMREMLGEQEIKIEDRSDTSIVKSIRIAGAAYYVINLIYDTTLFKVEAQQPAKQKLSKQDKNIWNWTVYGKHKGSDKITIHVKAIDAEGNENDVDEAPIQMNINVEDELDKMPVKFMSKPTFWEKYHLGIYGGIITLLLGGAVLWFLKRRKTEPLKKVYFSYAWGEDRETIVDLLYDSLEKDGFDVVRDKVDLEYRGQISSFMTKIGEGKMIIVAISDKYLKSKFCFFELFEIYRNSKMDKDEFTKKIFPIRVEDINLSDPKVVKSYIDYWQNEEDKWTKIIEEEGANLTPEQATQYQNVKRKVTELGNILYYLSDINALDIHSMQENDFAAIKKALRKAIDALD